MNKTLRLTNKTTMSHKQIIKESSTNKKVTNLTQDRIPVEKTYQRIVKLRKVKLKNKIQTSRPSSNYLLPQLIDQNKAKTLFLHKAKV